MSIDHQAEQDLPIPAEPANQSGFESKASLCARSRLKRLVDIAGSTFGLTLLAPGLLLVGLAVYCQDRGPVFFRQKRTGLHGKVFLIWKFRTMRHHTAKMPFEQTKGKNDPRVTPLGRWLRASSLDELPQLLNVFTGEMSLVGPRPHPVELDASLNPHFPNYAQRYSVRPGLTGVAQISGARGPVDCLDDMQRRLRFDLQYIRGWSIRGDIAIIFKTLNPFGPDKSPQ